MKKTTIKNIGLIGSIASIIGLLLFFLPKEKSNSIDIGNNNKENNVIQGNNNTINQETKIYTKSNTDLIKNLYANIINDYQSATVERIKQDFGEPFSEFENEGIIGPSYMEDECMVYNYSFKEGLISFYVSLNDIGGGKKHATVVMVSLSEKNFEINVPPFTELKLGKSTFKEIFELLGEPEEIVTNWGSAPGAVYTEIGYYLGRAGNYASVTFGISGFHDESVENNYKLLLGKKTRLCNCSLKKEHSSQQRIYVHCEQRLATPHIQDR